MSNMEIVIVGGGACGASCATRLRRLNERAKITILEKTNEISIANCGLPYYISDVINQREKILVSTPQKFKSLFNIDVCLNTEVVEINPEKKFVVTNIGAKLNYDKLVLAQGASPIVPEFKGMNKEKIFSVRTLKDADKIKEYIKEHNLKNVVVVGGGFIGVEMAENFCHLGLNTTLVELSNQILAPVDEEVAIIAQNEMKENGVNLILSDGVDSFEDNKIILMSGKKIDFDIVVMAIGVKPEIALAQKAGLKVNKGIIVNELLQTSNENIYAGGDNVEIKDFVSKTNTIIPLAGPANRQGRIIADNICSIKSSYKNSQGTSVVKVFNLTVASCGNNEKQLKLKNIPYLKTFVYLRSHAGYYPDSDLILFKLLFNNKGQILGVQGIGANGVEKRIDVIAIIMRNNGTIQEMIDSELCYAPPYSSAKDPVNILGMAADNILKGFVKPAFFEDLKDSFLIDVRPEISYKTNTIKGAINIPATQLRDRLNEIPKDKKVVLFCVTGYTSYVASRILLQNGFNNVYSLVGGFEFYRDFTRKVDIVKNSSILQNNVEQNNEIIKIDASGLQCPGPILKVAQNLKTAKQGTTFQIISTDRGFKSDIGAWCKTTGNTLLNLVQQDKKIIATVCKGTDKIMENKVISKDNGQTIVVFSNDLDKALASFIIANGAKASGKDVVMFFTFWGLNILRKSNIKVKKGFIDSIFGFMMPKGAKQLTLSKMNFYGLGTMMMKSVMKNKNISTLTELILQAQQSGIKFIACKMSMDVMGIKEEELIDGVEIGGVAKYIAKSNNANSNLFI